MRALLLATAATVALSGGSHAQTLTSSASAAAMFGVREGVLQASLSPDGNSVAFIKPTTGQGSAVYTVTIGSAAEPKRVLAASGSPDRLEWCRWVSNARLVCEVYFVQRTDLEVYSTSRIVAVNADGGDVKMLTRREGENALGHSFYGGSVIDWLPDESGAILMQQNYVPESKAGSLIEQKLKGLGVDRIDTSTLATKHVVTPLNEAQEYITDGRGNVRIMGTVRQDPDGYTGKIIRYQYRLSGKTGWNTLSEHNFLTDTGFNPYAVDAAQNVAYGFNKLNGRLALYKHTLDGTESEELVYSHPQVDVDGLIRIGKSRRVVGVTLATDRRQDIYFDSTIAEMRTKLGRAVGADQQISVVDASTDEQKLLLFVGRDTNPGKYYLLDRTTKKLGELFPSRPELSTTTLAPVKSISVKVADGTLVPAYLTLPPGSTGKNMPTIIMPHGGPGARDEWGFDWLSQFYANQGFAVLQPNFRGSAGYGDKWLQVNGYQSWKTAIGDVTDSGRWLIAEGIADPKRIAILGWSYGGYAALQSGVVAPDLFKAIVAIAPVTDFALLKSQSNGSSNQYVAREFVGSGPHITEGSPAQNVNSITAPVLMFHGTLDRNVKYQHSTMMASRLKGAGKSVELVSFDKLDHYLEDGAARTQMLAKSAAFLRSSMGMPAQ